MVASWYAGAHNIAYSVDKHSNEETVDNNVENAVTNFLVEVRLQPKSINSKCLLDQWFLTLLELMNPASFIGAFTEPFVIGKI